MITKSGKAILFKTSIYAKIYASLQPLIVYFKDFNILLTSIFFIVQLPPRKTYHWLYFDLDNTLWDFKQNSEITLKKLLKKFPLMEGREEEFLEVYYPINDALWSEYRQGNLTKEVLRINRFVDTFACFGINDSEEIRTFESQYLANAPLETAMFPQTLEVLGYLKEKGYRMFLLTNGFKEVQDIKIRSTGLINYFEHMFTSDEIGYQKPHRKIFEYAIKSVNAKKKQSLMIGDDWHIDIEGARKFGIDQVYFNPQKTKNNSFCTYEISQLSDLMFFL